MSTVNLNLLETKREEKEFPPVRNMGLDARIQAIFADTVGYRRTADATRAQIQRKLSLIHHGSSGDKHRLNLPDNDRTAQAKELFVDVKDAVLIHKGIDPSTVHDFRIQLHAKTCTFTDPVTGKKVRVDLLQDIVKEAEGYEPEARDKNANLKALFQAYFAGTNTIYKPHYQFTPGVKGPLNGAVHLSPTKETVKKHGKITGQKGFENAARTILSNLIPHVKEVPQRGQIVQRHAFGYLMHKQFTTALKKLIDDKEKALKPDPDLAALKTFREHLDKMDYFALNWALCNFPYVKPENSAKSLDEIEMDLEDEIRKAADIMEQDLRTYQSIGKTKATENDPKEAALEEEYNRNNCVGLLFLTRTSQLQNCQIKGIDKMKKESVEELFMTEMIRHCQSPRNYDGKGFKDYLSLRLSKDGQAELDKIIDDATDSVKTQMFNGGQIPDFNHIPGDYSSKTDPKAKCAVKDQISDDIRGFTAKCEKPVNINLD